MKWVTVLLGLALCLAPFVTGYNNNTTALWTSMILGVVVIVMGLAQQYIVAAIAGVITFFTPWVLGFSTVTNALWSCVILGGAVLLLTGYKAIVERREADSGIQHRV